VVSFPMFWVSPSLPARIVLPMVSTRDTGITGGVVAQAVVAAVAVASVSPHSNANVLNTRQPFHSTPLRSFEIWHYSVSHSLATPWELPLRDKPPYHESRLVPQSPPNHVAPSANLSLTIVVSAPPFSVLIFFAIPPFVSRFVSMMIVRGTSELSRFEMTGSFGESPSSFFSRRSSVVCQ
jgi:hypothetical protein